METRSFAPPDTGEQVVSLHEASVALDGRLAFDTDEELADIIAGLVGTDDDYRVFGRGELSSKSCS